MDCKQIEIIFTGQKGMGLRNFKCAIEEIDKSLSYISKKNGVNLKEIEYTVVEVKEGSICFVIGLPENELKNVMGIKVLEDFASLIEIRKKASLLSSDIQVIKENNTNILIDNENKKVEFSDEEFDLYTYNNKLDESMSKLCNIIKKDSSHNGIKVKINESVHADCCGEYIEKSSIKKPVENYKNEKVIIERFETWVNIIEASFDFEKKWKLEGVVNKVKYDALILDQEFKQGVIESNIHLIKKMKIKVQLETRYKEEKKKNIQYFVTLVLEKDYGEEKNNIETENNQYEESD